MIQIGRVCEIVRYPVKSMAGTAIESVSLGWHGLEGDRRFAFRRVGDTSGFPWLSASRLPKLVVYHPNGLVESNGVPLPTHVRTPAGLQLEIRSAELQDEIAEQLGTSVELMNLKHGVFDDAVVSMITTATIASICKEARIEPDSRRFRANIVVESESTESFQEDEWLSKTFVFGDEDRGPAVCVTLRDLRCSMVNIDPDTGAINGDVMKVVVRLNNNNAGVYATVVRTGSIQIGDRVSVISNPPK